MGSEREQIPQGVCYRKGKPTVADYNEAITDLLAARRQLKSGSLERDGLALPPTNPTGESVMDMIERAARALFKTEYNGPYTDEDEGWPIHIEAAKAVLMAIREPTPKMVASTWNHRIDNVGGIESQNTRNERIWQAMIDQALKG